MTLPGAFQPYKTKIHGHSDAAGWCKSYLKKTWFDKPFSDMHLECFDDLQNKTDKFLLVVAPRGFAKSTCYSIGYPLYAACNRKRKYIVIICHDIEHSKRIIRNIKHELETNPKILQKYGNLVPKRSEFLKWSQQEIILTNKCVLVAFGSKQQVRGLLHEGKRPDLIVVDDLDHPKKVYSQDYRDEAERWLKQDVIPMLARGGQLFMIGTLIHHDSLLTRMMDEKRNPYKKWHRRKYTAYDEDGNSIWPQVCPNSWLIEQKEIMGLPAFNQEFLAIPSSEHDCTFQQDWILANLHSKTSEELAHLPTYLVVDPSTGVGNDYSALCTITRDKELFYIQDLELVKKTFDELIDWIIYKWIKYRPHRVGIEQVAFQVSIKHYLQSLQNNTKELIRRIDKLKSSNLIPKNTNEFVGAPNVIGVSVAGKRKELRINSISGLCEAGKIKWPENIKRDGRSEIINQFVHFPNYRNDDAPDAVSLGVGMFKGFLKTDDIPWNPSFDPIPARVKPMNQSRILI